MINTEASITFESHESRSWLLGTLLGYLIKIQEAAIGPEETHRYLRQAAIVAGRTVDKRFRARLSLTSSPSSHEDFLILLAHVQEELRTTFALDRANDERIVLSVAHCAWGEIPHDQVGLCYAIACVYATLAARAFGYARLVIEDARSSGAACCRLHLCLQPDPTAPGEIFTRQETELPLEAILSPYSDEPARSGVVESPEGYAGSCQHTIVESEIAEFPATTTMPPSELERVKQEFLSNVSHELRTPITTMQGYLSLLVQGALGTLNEEQVEATHIVICNLKRLNRLVDDLLDFSSLARGQFMLDGEPVEIAIVLQAALQRTTESAATKGIILQADMDSDAGIVLGDEEKLIHIVAHLLENAIKFSAEGDTVTLSAHRQLHHVMIEIRDTGIGMTDEQLERVFAPFVQGDGGLARRYGGLGMGLSLIHNLVALHGGDITIRSKPAEGTQVLVTLPLSLK